MLNTNAIATMFGRSGGLEPEFSLSYNRRTESLHGDEEKTYKVVCKTLQDYCDVNGLNPQDDLELPPYFITSQEIDPMDRIHTQAVMQEHIDTAISSTINLPNEATVDDVMKIYREAYFSGLKGVTVFRDGCARVAILSTDKSTKTIDDDVDTTVEYEPLPRGYIIDIDSDVIGKYRKIQTGCGGLHCSAFFDPITGDLLQVYLSKGSTGGCNQFMTGLSRMISLAARGGIPIEAIIDQLNSSGVCPSYAVRTATKHDTSKGSSCPVAVGYVLKDMYDEIQSELGLTEEGVTMEYNAQKVIKPVAVEVKELELNEREICPQCGEPITHSGGCDVCTSCGWSKCE